MKWETVQISEFCKTGTGGTPSRSNMDRYYEGGTIPWVKSGELRENIITGTGEHVTEAALRETSIKLVPAGALLLALYGATVGRLGILGVEATTNQAVCHIIPDPKKANVRYLFHALSNQVSNLVARGVGGAQPNISQGIVKELGLMLPPLAEQKRIAAILDAADALRTKRREALAQLDALLQSSFLTLFGDPVTNPMGWKQNPIEALCDVGSSKRVFVHELVDHGVPFYRGTEIGKLGAGQTVEPSLFITQKHYDELKVEAGVPKKGDLLLPSICPDGRIHLVEDDKEFYFKDGRVLWIKSGESQIDSTFLRYHLKHLFASNYSRIASGTTFAELKIFALKELVIHVPPTNLQQKFAAIVESIERQKTTQRAHLAELDALFAALQHRAFRGEL